jgi:hypothetical protein
MIIFIIIKMEDDIFAWKRLQIWYLNTDKNISIKLYSYVIAFNMVIYW